MASIFSSLHSVGAQVLKFITNGTSSDTVPNRDNSSIVRSNGTSEYVDRALPQASSVNLRSLGGVTKLFSSYSKLSDDVTQRLLRLTEYFPGEQNDKQLHAMLSFVYDKNATSGSSTFTLNHNKLVG